MDPEISEYSLSWDGHIQHVRKAFNRLLHSNELCDVILYAEGQKIGAHKVFLAACSKYFDQLFKDFKDERPVVVLKGIQFDILKHILNFVYNGETNVELDQLNQFLDAAAFLNIDGLAENHIKRKRKHLVSESNNICYEHTDTSKLMAEITEKGGQHPSGKSSRHSLQRADIFPKPPKMYKIHTSSNKNQDILSNVIYPDFSKAPEIVKYPTDDAPIRSGEWLSDYEFNSQSSTVESQSPLDESTDNTTLGKNTSDPLIEESIDKPSNFEITNVKSEITSGPIATASDVEEISSFDQNDFANSLDAAIEISDDGEDDLLEKQLMKTPLASIDEKGLYQCKICSNSYVKKDSLKKHFAVHVDNTTCMICGKVLSRKTHLIRHLRVHGISTK